MKAALLISHGSRSPKTKEEVERLVKELQRQSGLPIFGFAFLEIEAPDIISGLEDCIFKGAHEIIVLCNFLNSGRHVSNDIPDLIERVRRKHPNVKIALSMPVGQHPKIAEIFLDFINHA